MEQRDTVDKTCPDDNEMEQWDTADKSGPDYNEMEEPSQLVAEPGTLHLLLPVNISAINWY